MNAMRMPVLCALLMTGAVPFGAKAHEFWLQPKQFWSEPTQAMPLTLRVGHGDHSARSSIPARRMTRFEVIGPGADTQDLRGKVHPGADTDLQLDAPGTYVVVLATDNQARSDLPAEQFNDYLRAEGLTPALVARERAGLMRAEGSERYSRHAKSLVQVGASQQRSHVTEAVGLRLEIVPEIDPYAQPRSAQLPVRVIFEDKPLTGALVKLSSPINNAIPTVSRLTDDHGRAVFEMPSQGEWLLHVTWTKALPSTDEADFDTVFASLTFGLPGSARPFTASDLVTLRQIGSVTVSPDGRWLAYASAGSLQLRDLANGEVKSIVDWQAQVRSIAWAADSRSLLVTARVGMDEPLFQIALDAKKVTRLTTEGHVTNVIPLAQGGAAFTVDTMLQPADVYRLSAQGELKRLTAINEDRLRDIDLPHVERFDSGWVIAAEAPRAPRPTVLLIQDESGPANGWSPHWSPLLLAAPGYAVLGINVRDSSKFALEDLKRGFAAAADRFPALDPDNVCIAGNGAYGGYLAYRIAGEWSRQPRCLIANGGVVDATRVAYETDEPWMRDWQKLSDPLHHVSAWRTPLLILHGERNFRVPYTQSLVAYTAAQLRNVPSRLVVFPDEGIQLRVPKNTIQWYGEVFNWLDRWLLQRD